MLNNTAQQLIDAGGSLFGSHAFGVETSESDIDIFIYVEDIPDNVYNELLNVKQFPIENYFNYYPSNEATYFKYKNTDIIVFDEKSDFEYAKSCVEKLKRIPKEYLAIKNIRVDLFQYELAKKWITKRYEIAKQTHISEVGTDFGDIPFYYN